MVVLVAVLEAALMSSLVAASIFFHASSSLSPLEKERKLLFHHLKRQIIEKDDMKRGKRFNDGMLLKI